MLVLTIGMLIIYFMSSRAVNEPEPSPTLQSQVHNDQVDSKKVVNNAVQANNMKENVGNTADVMFDSENKYRGQDENIVNGFGNEDVVDDQGGGGMFADNGSNDIKLAVEDAYVTDDDDDDDDDHHHNGYDDDDDDDDEDDNYDDDDDDGDDDYDYDDDDDDNDDDDDDDDDNDDGISYPDVNAKTSMVNETSVVNNTQNVPTNSSENAPENQQREEPSLWQKFWKGAEVQVPNASENKPQDAQQQNPQGQVVNYTVLEESSNKNKDYQNLTMRIKTVGSSNNYGAPNQDIPNAVPSDGVQDNVPNEIPNGPPNDQNYVLNVHSDGSPNDASNIAPNEAYAAPYDPNVVPNEPNAVPNGPNVVPNEPNAVPYNPNVVPNEPNAVANEANAAPNEPNAVPYDPNSVPNIPNGVPNAMPYNPNGVPYDPNAVPNHDASQNGAPNLQEIAPQQKVPTDVSTEHSVKIKTALENINQHFGSESTNSENHLQVLEDLAWLHQYLLNKTHELAKAGGLSQGLNQGLNEDLNQRLNGNLSQGLNGDENQRMNENLDQEQNQDLNQILNPEQSQDAQTLGDNNPTDTEPEGKYIFRIQVAPEDYSCKQLL